jgi:hypothetical protein
MDEPSVFERVVLNARCIRYPEWEWPHDAEDPAHPECALHALATSDEVREAWTAVALRVLTSYYPEDLEKRRAVAHHLADEYLAALDPEARQERGHRDNCETMVKLLSGERCTCGYDPEAS